MIVRLKQFIAAPSSVHAIRRAALALALAASRVVAQPPAESGIARAARSNAPLACLHVVLIDSADRAVAHTVTDSAGTFVLVAPSAGSYRLGFEIAGWERLAGPVDTLKDGEMRERAYPLDFGDSAVVQPLAVAEQRRGEDAVWHGAVAGSPDVDIRFPIAMRRSGQPGSVVAEYVVDPTGRVRADSWRPITSSHPAYLTALRAHVPSMRYAPARLDGQPVCQLVRNQVRFGWAGPIPTVTLSN